MAKKLLIVLSIIFLFMITSVGCGSGKASEKSSTNKGETKKVTLRIASAETSPSSMKALIEIGQEYEKLTGVKVEAEAIPLADIYAKITSTLNTSGQYDIFLTGFIGHVAVLKEKGLVESLDDVIEKIGGKKDFKEKILFPIDGKVYWIPYDYNLAYLYIRKDWLNEKGLTVPKTWDELLNVAKALTDKEKNRYGIFLPLKSDTATDWLTTGFLWSNDVKIFDDKWNVIFDSPEMKPKVVETLNLLKKLHQYMPPGIEQASYSETIAAFTSGQVAMAPYSGRIVETIETKAPDLADKFEVFGFPTKDGNGSAVTFGYDGMAVIKSQHSDEAKKFLEWFYKEKIIDFLHSAPVHMFPAQESIYQSEKWRSHPLIKKYWESGVKPQYDLLQKAKMNSIDTDGPYMDVKPGIVLESYVIPKMFQRVLLNNENPEKVVDETAAEIRNMVKGK